MECGQDMMGEDDSETWRVVMEKDQRDGILEECCRLGREQEWEGVIRGQFRPETLLSLDGGLLVKDERAGRPRKEVQTGLIGAGHRHGDMEGLPDPPATL